MYLLSRSLALSLSLFLSLSLTLSDTFLCANKLLCFTRSSPIIHQFPTKYPSMLRKRRDEPQDDTEDTTLLRELVCEDPNRVKVCKISSVQSQSVIHEVLRDFIRSPNQKILLLLANMQVGVVIKLSLIKRYGNFPCHVMSCHVMSCHDII